VDRSETLLTRSLGAQGGALVEPLHRDAGVQVLTRATVSGVGTASSGAARVEVVHLLDGTTLPVDIVVLAVGARPATGWLTRSGVTVDDGVITDRFGRTTAAGVYAAGDVARPFSPAAGRHERSAHWTAAVTAGDAVAANILAGDCPANDVVGRPYFWSDQYGTRVQVVGTRADGDELTLETAADARRTVGVFSRAGVVTAALAINAAGQLPRLGRLLGQPLPCLAAASAGPAQPTASDKG
jgi:NADPH-dependent 2,4-dienoyl-CoA reductase/sulfur reductase-like enzyme